MQQMLHTTKRAVSVAVAAATIAFTVGLAGLVAPSRAAAASAGDLIKGSLSTVYYYGYDGMRYTFPNEKTYMTWYSDFSNVTTISDSSLANLELAGNVVYRPGSRFIKITSDPKVYAVSTNGAIHWIETADVAAAYAGSDWATNVQDVPDAFFADYTTGASLMTATAFDGAMYMDGGNYYLSWGGEKRMVSSAGRSANNLMASFFMDGTGIDDSSLSAGADITTATTALMDPAQTESMSSDVTGAVSLSLSSSTPAGATLPQGANSVEVLSIKATAGSAAASIGSLAFTQSGAGSTSDVSNAYLYEGNTRLTEARSVNASTRMVTFSNLNWAVAANSSRTFTLRITTSSSATPADVMSFGLAAATDATASGTVSGSFPITGNSFSISGADSGTITLTKTGTITNPTIGAVDAVIGEFKLAAASEAASVQDITLKIDNASDHSNFKLWRGSTQVATGVNTSGDIVVFDMTSAPYSIADGASAIFSVSADIGGQNADSVKVYVDNSVDVVAIGGDYGFGMALTNTSYDGTSCTSSAGSCSFSTIQGGDLTLALTGPTTGDIRTNSQDQTLLAFTMTSSQELTIKDLDVIVYGDDNGNGNATDGTDDSSADSDGLINNANSTTEANLKDIKIINVDTGAVVMGPLELDCTAAGACSATGASVYGDASQTIDFTDDFSMTAGESLHLAVTADIDNNATSGTAFAAAIDMSGLTEEDSNGDALSASDIVPSGDITGYNQTARAASAVISLASTPGIVTSVQGTNDVLSQAFNIVAGQGGDINISEVIVSVYADDTDTSDVTLGDNAADSVDVNDYITSCYLKDINGNTISSSKSPSSDGKTLTFDSMDWTLAASASSQIKVYCNYSNPSATATTHFAFDIATPASDVVAEDTDGNDVDPTVTGGSSSTTNPNLGTAPTNYVTLASAGSLAVTAGASTPQADFVLTSSSSNHVATYRYTATNEAFEIQTVSFSEEQAEDDTSVTDSTAYANDISLVTITYPLVDGTTGTSSVAMTSNYARFTGLHAYVSVANPADIDVYVNVPSTDRDAGGSATSNEKIRMGWYVGGTPDGTYFKAVGVGSGTTFTDTDSDGSGTDYTAVGDDRYSTDGIATFVVRETKPTFSLSSSSPSGNTAPGLNEALRFNVAASSNEDVVLESLLFKTTATDIVNNFAGASAWANCDTDIGTTSGNLATSEFDFYNLTKSSSTQLDTADTDWIEFKTTGAICTTSTAQLGYIKLTLPTPEIIPAGSTYTYSLKVDTTGASAGSDDSFRVDVVSEPIASSFVATTVNSAPATLAIGATSITPDGGSADFYLGDVLCLTGGVGNDDTCDATDERVLVVACASASATNGGLCGSNELMSIDRGYMGSNPLALASATNTELLRLPGSMLWQDDGSVAAGTTTQTRWGGYLVKSLSVTGGTLVF